MTVEQRLDQLEKRNKRLTLALTMTVVAGLSPKNYTSWIASKSALF